MAVNSMLVRLQEDLRDVQELLAGIPAIMIAKIKRLQKVLQITKKGLNRFG